MTFLPRSVNFNQLDGTDPAAGVEVSQVIPAGEMWWLGSFRVTLTCDATVANRTVQLQYTGPAANIYWFTAAQQVQTASQVVTWSFAPGLVGNQVATGVGTAGGPRVAGVPCPNTFLEPGGTLATVTANLQAGDDFGIPHFTYRKWRV